MLKNKKKYMWMLTFIVTSMTMFFIWQNNNIVTTDITYSNPKIPIDFNGFTIVQISDLHNKSFGKDQKYLLNKIKYANPDIIVITGDLIDRRKYNLDTAMVFIEGAVDIAPVYYVSGNHEAWSGDYENIKRQLLDQGVNVLDDEKIDLTIDESEIEIIGLSDPDFLTSSYMEGTDRSNLENKLKALSDDSIFQILLCHRPELFDIYVEEKVDLIFTGHAHGGQFRIPYLGGLVAPDQGLFPEYTSGIHKRDESSMLVNRGLGNSIIPIRIFNRPEIVKVILQSN